MGRHVKRQFAKSKVSIVERLMNKIMRTERNSGKKNKAYSIVEDALEIINKKTNENPIQVLVKAVENTAPREETTRIKYGGIGYQIAVDIAPQRRVDLSLGFLTQGAMQSAFKNTKSVAQCLADEILLAADEDSRSYALQKKEEKERVARSAH
jgi:small subunit ribosomal protein S7